MPKQIQAEIKESLRKWGYHVWEIHWKELAPVSNSRAQFLKYVWRDFEKLDDAELKRIELAVQAQTKHWRLKAKADGKAIGIPTLSVWYNQGRYDDEFIDESAASLKERVSAHEIKQCCHDGCKQNTHGPAYMHCADHIPDSNVKRLRDAYKGLKLDPKKGNVKEQLKNIFAAKLEESMEKMDLTNV